MPPANSLVLFDIDGTLLRRAGPHHRLAIVEAVRKVTGLDTTTDGVPVAGMLDIGIIEAMLRNAGVKRAFIRESMPAIVAAAERAHLRTCPLIHRRVCPGVRGLLRRLVRQGAVTGLVTGNLTRIGWNKMRQAGLSEFFRFGEFGETAPTRAALVRNAVRRARREGWISREARVTLIGDHINDILAARANRVQSIAVGTGILSLHQLAEHRPDILVPDMRSISLDALL
ncbi:MAG TPA: HAD family hydrolase [Bryobacteraceae bacterium]|nr:HAD family hydrolase [Bryobacteraceae bacterium]